MSLSLDSDSSACRICRQAEAGLLPLFLFEGDDIGLTTRPHFDHVAFIDTKMRSEW